MIGGVLRIDVNTPTGSFYQSQEYPNIRLGTAFGFEAGSCLLNQENPQGWSCGSAGVMCGSIGAAVYIRKHEDLGKFKIDFQDIEIKNGRKCHPVRNPHEYGYEEVHHKPIEPWKVTITWIQDGNPMIIDSKSF